MPTDSRSCVQAIISQAEEISGFKVEVMPDRNLPTHATVRMARGGMASHVILYNPQILSNPDYFIAFECGFIIRKFSLAPQERRDFVGMNDRLPEILAQIKGVPREHAGPFAERIFEGILLELRSMPPTFRVDTWIRHNFPALHGLQDAAVAKQLGENVQVINPSIQKVTPPLIYDANVAMNAAHALYWSRLADEELLFLPYRSTRFGPLGEELLEIIDSFPDDPAQDSVLIDRWAEKLGLQDWYRWFAA